MTVKEVMTPLQHTFMLNYDERLNFETIARIFKTGYSRIPVYEVSVSNIIGLLFVKDLIFIDPEDETPLRNFIQIFGRGKSHFCFILFIVVRLNFYILTQTLDLQLLSQL